LTEPLRIYDQWHPVQLQKDGAGYLFPERFTPFMNNEYARPAVYRWRVFPSLPGKKEEVYIGEAEILVRRAQRVLSAKDASNSESKTDYRLRKYFDGQVKISRNVALEWLDFQPFEIECVRFEAGELWDPFKRKCIENLALTIAAGQQWEILNVYTDPISKTLKKFLGLNISGKRLREVVEQIRLAKAPIVTEKEARKVVVRARL